MLVKIAGWILAVLPRQFAQLLSFIIGDCIYFLPTNRRRTILSNFHHTFPDKPVPWRRRKARQSCRRLVEMALFKLALSYFPEGRLDKTLIATEEATELLTKYLNPAKPLIGVTIHNSMMEACTLIPRSLHLDLPEIGVLYSPLNQKKLNDYFAENRSKYGITLFDRRSGLHEARSMVKNNKWMILIFDQSVGDSGYLTFFLNRAVTTTGFHQLLAQAYDTDVLAFYGERTGFWEGNLHVEKISDHNKDKQVLLNTNQWLEDKLMGDEAFCEDWLWIHDRWKGKTDVSHNLNLDYPKSLADECKQFYHWDALPRNNRIWFRMPNHLGDLVKWIPFIKAVRQSRPDAEITLLVKRQFTRLLEAFQVADRILPIPKRSAYYFKKFLAFRHQFPDTYYELTDSRWADLEARLVNAPRRYGIRWPGNSRHLLTNTFDVDPGWDDRKNHQVDLWKEFLGHFGLNDEIDFTPVKVAPGSEVINPLRCLQTESHDAPYFGLICGAGNHPEKCWPVDYWVECVAALMDLYPDSNICLFGTKSDLPVSRQIIEQFEPGSIHDFTGSTNLMQFVMALRSCSVVISNDCGGLHLANALGVATVGLYGVTNPVYTKPIFNSPVEIVQPSDCPNYGGTSSKQICLSQVIEAIADLVVQPEHAERETTLVS